MSRPWIDIEERPLPIRRPIEALHNDGKTVVVGRCVKIGNAVTDRTGLRWVVTHWRPIA
jgi:hypothetical protein